MCVKDQCNFKIIPGKRKESEDEYDCPKGTTCVDSFGDSSKEMENDQQEDENGNDIDSLNKAKPTKKQKATKAKSRNHQVQNTQSIVSDQFLG